MKTKQLVFLAVLFLALAAEVFGASYYVSTTGTRISGASTAGNWSDGNCYSTIGAAIEQMSSGDEVVVNDGTYTGTDNFINNGLHPIPNGTSTTNMTTIKARNRLKVTIKNSGIVNYYDSPVRLNSGKAYIHVDGFILEVSDTDSPLAIVEVSGTYCYVSNCIAIRKGVADDYSSWFYLGGTYNLIEDCAGAGHVRYGFASGSANGTTDHNIFRRCVGRADYSDSGQPMATFNFYGNINGNFNAQYVAFQNCIAIDGHIMKTDAGAFAYAWGGFYFPHGIKDVILRGSISLNVDCEQGAFAIKEEAGHNVTMTNCVAWDTKNTWHADAEYGFDLRGSGNNVTIDHCTFGGSYYGLRNSSEGTSHTIKNNLFYNNNAIGGIGGWTIAAYNGFSPSNQSFGTNSLTNNVSLSYLCRIENGTGLKGFADDSGDIGATIIKKHGTTGAFWGQPGWDTLTNDNLWPWMNEDEIRTAFRETNNPNSGAVPSTNDTARGFCADGTGLYGGPITLSSYIWEYLGNPAPQIYVKKALSIATISLPNAQVNSSYSQTLNASGGTTPYAWSVFSGSLPTGLNINVFTGVISGTPTIDGTWNFTVEVIDAVSDTATKDISITITPPDTTPPIISNISSSSITSSSVTISWTTNEPTTSLVEYGLTTVYGSLTALDSSLVTNHSARITGLDDNTTYHYRVKSKDAAGNETISGDYSFTTYKETTNYDAITQGQNWKYFKGINDPGSNWMALNYDDLGWLQGPTGIGYGDGDDATVLSDMQYNYVTVYMRKPFSLGNIETVTDLVLNVDYDDGFVAYINGTEVARTTNIAGAPDRNTMAYPDHEAGALEVFNISSYISLLNTDNNILAIEVHNTSMDSSDLSIIPKLSVTGVQRTPDTTPPTGSVSINNGADKTSTTSVTLTLSATDSGSGMGSGAEMQFSNDNVPWSDPEPYATTKNWTLTAGNGTQTVYVKFKDASGNWSTAVSDTIELHVVAPARPRGLKPR